MTALILSGGEPPSKALYMREAARAHTVICADGAANWALEYGAHIDCLVGDLDSVTQQTLRQLRDQGVEIRKLNPHKDETDTHMAIDIALQQGAQRLVLLGATGKRLDHTLANLQLLVRIKKAGADGVLMDDFNEITVTNQRCMIQREKGALFSVLPLSEGVHITLGGLEYPLNDHELKLEFPIGVSNVYLDKRAYVDVSGGWVALFKPTE